MYGDYFHLKCPNAFLRGFTCLSIQDSDLRSRLWANLFTSQQLHRVLKMSFKQGWSIMTSDYKHL